MKNWLYIPLGFLALVSWGIIFFSKRMGGAGGSVFLSEFFVWNAYAHQHKKIMIAPPTLAFPQISRQKMMSKLK